MPSLKHSLGFVFVAIILICSVLLWLFASPHPPVFTNFEQTALSLGQLSAVIGATLFALNFILAARFHFLERIFLGLNRMYFYHHYQGAVVLTLLLIHPLLLSLQYLPISVIYSAKFFLPSLSAPEIIFGELALASLVLLLYLTFFTRLRYQVWKFTHQFLGIAFSLAIIHMLLIPGSFAQNLPLKIYLLSLSALALYSFLYRTWLSRFLVKKHLFTVSSTRVINGSVTEIVLSPVRRLFSYLPGQFIFINVRSPGINPEQHPFSLTSSPSSPFISIAAKSLGDYTKNLKLIKVGSPVLVEGPFGVFSYLNARATRQVWIAGGIGITPFLGMARHLDPKGPYNIHLIYSVKDKAEAVYVKELQSLSSKNSKFRLTLYNSSVSGRLDSFKIQSLVPDLIKRDVFICGPAAMMAALRAQLHQLGLRNSRIYTEEFTLYQGK